MSSNRLQELYAKALARRSTGVIGGQCVSPEEMIGLVRREGPEEHRLRVLDHVMACADCRREFDLLRAIEEAGSRVETRPRSLSQRFSPLALAASLLIVVGIGLAVRSWVPTRDTVRGHGAGLVLLTPPSEIPAGRPVSFAWRPLAGARRYELEILDERDSVAFAGETSDTTLVIPPERLRAGAAYRWWVRDATPGSQRSSSLRDLRVRRE